MYTHQNVHSFALKPCNEEAKALVIPRRVSHSQCCERLNREWARQCEMQLSGSPGVPKCIWRSVAGECVIEQLHFGERNSWRGWVTFGVYDCCVAKRQVAACTCGGRRGVLPANSVNPGVASAQYFDTSSVLRRRAPGRTSPSWTSAELSPSTMTCGCGLTSRCGEHSGGPQAYAQWIFLSLARGRSAYDWHNVEEGSVTDPQISKFLPVCRGLGSR